MKINTLRHNLKHLRFKIRHKLFLLERKWVCHPFFGKFYPKKSIYRRFIAVVLALIVISSTTLFYLRPQTTEAAWFDDSYAYRQKITFVHNAALSNAAMRLTVSNTNTLITAGKMQTDCDDSRFTDSNGELLRYKLVSGCNSASTVYDVVFPTVLNGTNLAYFYYGNPQAASLSDSSVPTGTTPSGATSFATEEKGLAPVVAYSFDEGYGTIAHSTGSCATCSGTLTNMASPPASSSGWTDNGKLNKALNFDGLNDRVVLSNNQLVKPATDMSVSFWVKLNRTASQKGSSHMFVYKNHTASPWYSYQFYQLETDNKLYFQWINNSNTTFATTSKSALETNRWYHIAYVKSGSAGKIYLNGVDDTASTDNHTGTIFDSNADFSVGGISPKWTDGAMDEVKLYNYALTEAQVKKEFNRSASAVMGVNHDNLMPDGLIAYWPLDNQYYEGVNVLDQSGNNKTLIATKGGDLVLETESFTTVGAGTWTSPSDVTSIIVEAWGGGGAGARRTSAGTGGGGGGGGAYAKSTVAVSPSTEYNFYVGWVGVSNPATDGENTTFETTTVVAAGGKTPAVDSTTGALGGAIADSTGDERRNGGDGANGTAGSGAGGGSSAASGSDGTDATGSTGATAPAGGGDGGNGTTNTGFPGYQPGGGGGGAKYFFVAQNGGDGGAGKISISYNIQAPIVGNTGKYAEGFEFDGTNDKITSSTTISSIQSVSFWASPSATTEKFIDFNGSGTNIQISSGTVIANGFSNPVIYVDGELSSTFPDTNWHHVVIVSNTPVNATALNIGLISGDYYDGTLDEIRFYNRALSALEAGTLYNWSLSPLAHWKFDENTGDMAYDSTGNDYHASSSAPLKWARGKYGSSLYFNGINDVIAGRGINLDDFTISGWFKTDGRQSGIQGGTIIQIGDEDANYVSVNIDNNGKIDFGLSAQNLNLLTYSRFDDNKWHHFSVEFEGNTGYIYVDGVAYSYSTGTFSGTVDNLVFLIGGAEASYFKGYIDDLKVYSYRRTSKQIISDMNAGHPAVGSPIASAIAHYKFDEGYGTTANNSGSGGTALNGTLTSMDSPATYGSGWTNSGKFGKAVNFDGNNDNVSVPSNPSLAITGDLTLSIWAKRNSANIMHDLIDYAAPGELETANHLYEFYLDASNNLVLEWEYNAGSNEVVTSSKAVSMPSGSWVHYMVTRNSISKQVDFYENGVRLGTTQTYTNNPTGGSLSSFVIGRDNASTIQVFDGTLDEVKIYNYALSADEVKTEYNQGKSLVLGALSTDADGQSTNSAARAYCPPGNTETNCASGLNPAPVGQWTLDERTGTTAYDTSGNGNSGTLNNGPVWTAGKVGQGLNLDGNDDIINAGSNTSIDDLFQAGATIEAWVNPASCGESNEGVLFEKNDWDFTICAAGSKRLRFFANFDGATNGEWNSAANSIDFNKWQHVAIVYDSSSATNEPLFYINGILSTTTETINPAGSHVSDSTDTLYMGAFGGGTQTYDGKIDDVRIYNYVRSPAQIAWDYNRGGPVGHWKFDECQGTTAYDSSGNGLHGTIAAGAAPNTSVGTCSSGTTTEMWNDGTNGKYSSSLGFDGTNDYVDIGDKDELFCSSDCTYSAWIKPTGGAGTNRYILADYRSLGDLSSFALRLNTNNKIDFFWENPAAVSPTATSTTATSLNTWYHVVGSWDGTTRKIYVNGVLEGSNATAQGNHDDVGGSMTIGRPGDFDGLYFNGAIDDVRVYNYALSPTQVRMLYNENSAVRFGPVTGSP